MLNGVALYNTIIYEKNPEVYWKIVETVFNTALECKASISHHRVGILRNRWISEDPGPISKILTDIKEALDPQNVLNMTIISLNRSKNPHLGLALS